MKNWITSIAVTVIFITCVEIMLPDNSMKKYCKFILGLILMVVIINPIIKTFTGGVPNVEKYFKNYESNLNGKIEKNEEVYKGNVDVTLKNFKYNMEKTCLKLLKDRFPNDNFEIAANASYDKNKNEFTMDSLEIGFSDGAVRKVKKVDINLKDKKNEKEENKVYISDTKISKYLSDYLNISEKKIKVYKIE